MINELRKQLEDTEREVDKRLRQLKAETFYFKTASSDLSDACTKVCEDIEKQVEIICQKAKRMGDKMRDDVTEFQRREKVKLDTQYLSRWNKWKEMQKVSQQIERVLETEEAETDDYHETLDEAQTALDVQSDSADSLWEQEIPLPYHHPQPVDETTLKTLVGDVQSNSSKTFRRVFNINNVVKPNWNYESQYMKLQGTAWCICIKHLSLGEDVPETAEELTSNSEYSVNDVNMRILTPAQLTRTKKREHLKEKLSKPTVKKGKLGIYLHMREGDDPDVKTCKAAVSIKLLNLWDDLHDIQQHIKPGEQFQPCGGGYGWNQFKDWQRFEDPKSGYCDQHGYFTIDTTITLKHVDKECHSGDEWGSPTYV